MIHKSIALIIFFTVSVIQTYAFQAEPALDILKDYSKIRDFTMSANQEEAYVTAQSNLEERSVILRLDKTDGKWNNVSVASFSGQYKDLEAFLSPDNLKLYFVSNRPIHQDSIKPKDYDIWYVERTSTKESWSVPKNMGAPVNTEANEFYPSIATNGNMYFTSDGPKAIIGKDDILMSKYENGNYTEPVNVKAVNTDSYEYNAFIAPDESYMIFGGYNRKDGLGSGDMYISFKENNAWTTPKNMGATINSKHMDFCPFVIGDQLYFTSRRSNINATSNLNTIDKLVEEFNRYDNGFSRIYKVSFTPKTFRK